MIILRDSIGADVWYTPISIIEHRGLLSTSGPSAGHYVCDVKDKSTSKWFRTNDEQNPVQIDVAEVSNQAYAVLFMKTED